MTTGIDERIKELLLEKAVLQQTHEQMVAAFQQQQQEFQRRVAENQNRFQQIQGALAELEKLNSEPVKRDGVRKELVGKR
jgi:uncharacterized protein involved in exopolysaccharide biosynthesis